MVRVADVHACDTFPQRQARPVTFRPAIVEGMPSAGPRGDSRGSSVPPRRRRRSMKTKAAVVYEPGKPIEIEELDLAGPREGEVLIRYLYAGLCHSDVHISHGDLDARLPHGARARGSGDHRGGGPWRHPRRPGRSRRLLVHPNCGTCHWCATGQQAICDMGATILEGYLPGGRFPLTGPRGDYGAMCMLGTFSQYGTIHQNSVVKVERDLPLDKAVLVGCGVPTGWGSAVNAATCVPVTR